MPETPHTAPPPAPPDAAAGYRPISGLAIAALGLAVVTALIITAIGIASRVKGKAILVWPLVGLAAVGLVMSLVARWQIRRSEGTRAGLGLANAAWWVSLLFGCGYAAFLAATELAVRQQAQEFADKWFKHLSEGKPELAFRLTRDPSQQKSIPEDPDAIRRRFGADTLPAFIRSDLARMCRSWRDKVRWTPTGVRELQTTPSGYEVVLNYTVRTPEGVSDVGVMALGHDDPATGARNWQINFNITGIRERQFTRLGQIVEELQFETYRNFLPAWVRGLPQAKESPIGLFRIDGKVPPEDQRTKIAEELKRVGAINPFPGGPTRPSGMPVIFVDPDGVRLVCYVELDVPAVGSSIPAHVTVHVSGDELVKEMTALAGPGWEQQPVQTTWPVQLQPPNFPHTLSVTEINASPGGIREGPVQKSMRVEG